MCLLPPPPGSNFHMTGTCRLKGWKLISKIPTYGSHNVSAPSKLDSFSTCSKSFSRFLFLLLDLLIIRSENWFVVTSINVPLK